MGSFNTTCFVTRQTIAPEEVCWIAVVKQSSGFSPVRAAYRGQEHSVEPLTDSNCYATRFWAPVSGFLQATYDDYGRFKLARTPENGLKLMHFLLEAGHQMAVTYRGENPSHDLPFDLLKCAKEKAPGLYAALTAQGRAPTSADQPPEASFDELDEVWDALFEVMQENRLFWANYRQVLRPLQVAVMHDAAYRGLVSQMASNTDYRGNSLQLTDVFARAVQEAKEHADKISAKMAEQEKAPATAADAEKSRRMHRYMQETALVENLTRIGQGSNLRFAGEQDLLREAIGEHTEGRLNEKGLFERVLTWLEGRYVCAGLESFNLHFEPMVYAPQDYSNDIGKAYTQFVQETCREVTRHNVEKHYGALKPFCIQASNAKALDILEKNGPKHDSIMLPLSAKVLGEGLCELRFESHHDQGVLAEVLQEMNQAYPEMGLHLQTLKTG